MSSAEQSITTLKDGVILAPLNDLEFYLGLIDHGLYIPRDPYLAIARHLVEGLCLSSEVEHHNFPVSPELLRDFVAELDRYGYLQTTPPEERGRGIEVELRKERRSIEMQPFAWRTGVKDGGWGEIEARRNFTILIFGRTRIARALLALLQASGFSTSRIILPPSYVNTQIEGRDICGVVTRKNELGLSLTDHHKNISQAAQLLPRASENVGLDNKPALIISTDPTNENYQDYLQIWMSEELPHLEISQPNPFTIEFGPLVIPGEHPCLTCVALHKRDQLPPFLSLAENSYREVASASATLIAGVITSYVCEYAATGKSALESASIALNLLNPLTDQKIRQWDFHPECGCR